MRTLALFSLLLGGCFEVGGVGPPSTPPDDLSTVDAGAPPPDLAMRPEAGPDLLVPDVAMPDLLMPDLLAEPEKAKL